MENETKDKELEQLIEALKFDEWDEEQFYIEVIMPKLKEVVELLNSKKIPYLINVAYSNKAIKEGECLGCANVAKHQDKKCLATAKILACGKFLSKADLATDTMKLLIL